MRSGQWICTFSGVKWFINDPHPDDVRITDIAHALSLACRFGGHTKCFYSVAEHSVHVSRILQRQFPLDIQLHLHGLAHDFSEAYIADVVRPLKQTMPDYAVLEQRTMEVIYEGLNLGYMPATNSTIHAEIKDADNQMLMTERRDLINHGGHEWTTTDIPDPIISVAEPWSPWRAESEILKEYEKLHDRLKHESRTN